MKFIFFDTNAFYNYVGRNNITPDTTFVSSISYDCETYKNNCANEIKSLCSCSFMEMMTRFRNEKEAIKNIINLIEVNDFLISKVGKKDFDDKSFVKEIKDAIYSNNDSKYNTLMDDICLQKSRMEANWIYTFAADISLCYMLLLAEEFDKNEQKEDLKRLYSMCFENNIQAEKDDIAEKLFNGYKSNAEKETAKTIFYEYIWEFCLVARTFLEYLKAHFQGKDTSKISNEEFKKEIEKDIPSSTETNKKEIAEIITNFFKNNPAKYETFIDSLIDKFNDNNQMDLLQSKYIRTIIDKLFKVHSSDKSQEFKKNDIIDFIVLGSISGKMLESIRGYCPKCVKDDLLLVTFDKSILLHLKDNCPNSFNFISNFYTL